MDFPFQFDLDNSVGILKDIPCGYYAERKTQNDNWLVKKQQIQVIMELRGSEKLILNMGADPNTNDKKGVPLF